MNGFMVFIIGFLSFFGPFIIHAIDRASDENNEDFAVWMHNKGLNQIYMMEGMILAGMLLMNAGMMVK